jgi:hypothetical protein
VKADQKEAAKARRWENLWAAAAIILMTLALIVGPSSDGLLFLSLALTGFLAAAFCAWVARIVEERR